MAGLSSISNSSQKLVAGPAIDERRASWDFLQQSWNGWRSGEAIHCSPLCLMRHGTTPQRRKRNVSHKWASAFLYLHLIISAGPRQCLTSLTLFQIFLFSTAIHCNKLSTNLVVAQNELPCQAFIGEKLLLPQFRKGSVTFLRSFFCRYLKKKRMWAKWLLCLYSR